MKNALLLFISAGTLAVGVPAVFAQDAAAEPAKTAAPAPVVTWSDAEIEALAKAMTGSWKGTAPGAAAAGDATEVVVSIAPVALKEVPDALYMEVAFADSLNRPFRQVILQAHRIKGDLRLKTLEFRRKRGTMESVYGLWAAPDAFPNIGLADLVATLDTAVSKESAGWSGKTLHPYPTSRDGATEMTSAFSLSGDRFETNDQGFDAAGKLVWGSAKGESAVFEKFEAPVKVRRFDGGVVSIEFPAKLEGATVKDGEFVSVHYVGYLEDGRMFDASYERGSPMRYPHGTPFISGWSLAMTDVQKGMLRRLVIPGPMAYGDAGNPRAKIPGNATLFFDIEVVNIEPPPAPPQPVAPPTQPEEKKAE